MSFASLIIALKGGSGSGNWGHAGRQGKRGGSAPKSGIGAAMSLRTGRDWQARQAAAKNKASVNQDIKIPINQFTLEKVESFIANYYDPDDVTKALNNLKNLVDGADVNMRVPADVLENILKDGRFKNQHETGTSRGMLDPDYRLEAERNAFGEYLSKPEELPIYAYINTYDKGFRPSVSNYGDVRIVFNEDVKRRTTITAQDSLTPFSNLSGAPTPLLNPGVASLDGDVDIYRTSTPSWGYIEAQVHGGLSVKDIKHVYIPDDSKLKSQLDSAGIPYTVATGDKYYLNMDALK